MWAERLLTLGKTLSINNNINVAANVILPSTPIAGIMSFTICRTSTASFFALHQGGLPTVWWSLGTRSEGTAQRVGGAARLREIHYHRFGDFQILAKLFIFFVFFPHGIVAWGRRAVVPCHMHVLHVRFLRVPTKNGRSHTHWRTNRILPSSVDANVTIESKNRRVYLFN